MILTSPFSKLTNEQLEKIYTIRDRFEYSIDKTIYFPSQRDFSNKILKSVFNNEGQVLVSEWTRQHGKTTVVARTMRFLTLFYFPLCNKLNLHHYPFFNIGLFAPLKEQSQTPFNMMKALLIDAKKKGFDLEFDEFNGNTINIHTQYPPIQIYCFTASPASHPESKTLNVIIYDESQDLDDKQIEKAIEPMGAATNATQIFIGVAGYRRCKFFNLIESLPLSNKLIIPVGVALKERQWLYQKTQNPIYLNYQFYIDKTIRLLGLDENSDHYKTQYLLQWILERGQFITYDNLMALEYEYTLFQEYTEPLYGGIDWGKMHDSTIFTIIDKNCNIIGWHEFLGDDYSSQIENIFQLCTTIYKGMKMINCDSTGTQDMGVDMLRAGLRKSKVNNIMVNGINFSTHKDPMYKNLSRLMHNVTMGRDKDNKPIIIEQAAVKFPKNYPEQIKKEKFIRQFLDLQKVIKNNKWHCDHPEGPQYHDDYADSLALACYSFKPVNIPHERRFLVG